MELNKFEGILEQLKSKVTQHSNYNLKVSNASVGWHISHSILTAYQIIETVKNSNPNEYQKSFNRPRMVVKLLNFIPRGKAKAPKKVTPNDLIDEDSLNNQLKELNIILKDWDQMPKNAYFVHPIFGKLNKKDTEWFLNLHTKHHLKIANDICNKS